MYPLIRMKLLKLHNYGAEVIQRPEALAEDTSAEWGAWQHAIYYVEEKYGCLTSL